MDQPLLHELGLAIVDDFDKLLEVERNNEWLKSQDLTSEAERFRLWAQNLGLFQQGHASLDYRVRDAVLVRDRLAELLRELAEHIRELLLILLGEKTPAEEIDAPNDNSSSSGASSEGSIPDGLSSEDYEFHETEYRFQSLTERLDALYSLATKIRNPKNRPSLTNDRLYKNIPEQSRSEYIHKSEEMEANIVSYFLRQDITEASRREKNELVDSVASDGVVLEETLSQYASPNCWIVRRTGKANAKRKQQLVYWKSHALRLGQVEKQPMKKIEPTFMEQGVTPSQHTSPSNLGRVQPAAPSLATSASKMPNLKPDDLKSVISHQSRVSTAVSVQSNDLNWPLPPAIAGNKRYFECPYCKTICPVKYLEKGAWEKHITHDLQAYHCTYEQCQDPNRLYGSKQEWLNHESQHNRVWICQRHDAEFETQPDYIAHLEAEHSQSQPDHLSDVLIGTAVGTSSQIHRNCPFCPRGFTEIVEMQQHIAFHLVRLALLALSPLDSGSYNENDSESMQSRRPQQRGRTQSIFDDFRLGHGLQRIPCEEMHIGPLGFDGLLTDIFAFYNSEESTFCFSFKIPSHGGQGLRDFFQDYEAWLLGCEYIIEYHMTNVSSFTRSPGGGVLQMKLITLPRFYIRNPNDNNKTIEALGDSSRGQRDSPFLIYTLRSAPEEHFVQFQNWLVHMMASTYEKMTLNQGLPLWSTALERLDTINFETTNPNSIYQWIPDTNHNVYPAEDIDQVVLPDDVDNMIHEKDWMLWRSESEYHAAQEITKAIRRGFKKLDGVETLEWVKGTNIVTPILSGFIARYCSAMAASIGTRPKTPTTRVALIDTRMRLFEHEGSISANLVRWPDDMLRQVDAVKSFVTAEDLNKLWMNTSSLSTNQIARLVCSIDPFCRLYIAQVDKTDEFTDMVANASDFSIAKAINWAVDCDVDVISLGFKIHAATETVKKAIQRARDNDIVVLCSLDYRNNSRESQVTLFSGPDIKDDCFIIAARDAVGNLLDGVPEASYNYCFAGSCVHARPAPLAPLVINVDSSVATAVAAGVVSLIVASCRLGNENNVEPKDEWRRLFVERKLHAMCEGKDFVVLDNICEKEREYPDFMAEIRSNFPYLPPGEESG